MNAAPLFRLRNLSCHRGGRAVLRDVTFDLFARERVALIGANGAGKTTLLHAMVGLVDTISGSIEAFGADRRTDSDFADVRARAGLLFQDPDDQLFCPTVIEDVAFGPLNLGQSVDSAYRTAEGTLAQLGIAHLSDRITHRLSGGEKRLVSLATVLAMQPEVLLLDEPTNALDKDAFDRFAGLLDDLACAMVLVTHDHALLERLGFRPIVLQGGILVAAELHRHPHVHRHQHGHIHLRDGREPQLHMADSTLHGHNGDKDQKK